MTYIFSIHLGSTVVTRCQLGNVYRNGYYPFGEERYTSSYTPYQFTGQRKEAAIGLYDYHARFYDPYLNHFVQPDTIIPDPSNPQSWNRYAYVNNNPINYNDPCGHVVCQGALSCESSSIFNDFQKSAIYQTLADQYENSGYSGYFHEYYITIASYYMALAQNNTHAAEANLTQVLNTKTMLMVNGFVGVDKSLDTAFRSAGVEVAGALMGSGVGIYGMLKSTNGLGLFDLLADGQSYSTDEVLSLGQNFVGDNPLTVDEGVYISSKSKGTIDGKEVYTRFRITDSDIAGHGGGQPHANFELVYRVTGPSGKVRYVLFEGQSNLHIYFSDVP
jgi:RHS repeat-associated protein